ncbi:MAG: phosphoribosylglycinamide formyltransferase [Saprospiraceae bacterium]|nr:phosphoribosylglycinamide formyltransferase [Saprospiraceae bacterium]
MIHIAIFASGGGSNAKAIIRYFENNTYIKVAVLLTNNPESGLFQMGTEYHIPCVLFKRDQFRDQEYMLPLLQSYSIRYIVLAGFLWLIPHYMITHFKDKIFNIHPSLLPDFGGKGMYGRHVHEAVKNAHKKESGCTIHLVNEEYDRGKILLQKSVTLTDEMSPEDIAKAVLGLEHTNYAPTIESYINKDSNKP